MIGKKMVSIEQARKDVADYEAACIEHARAQGGGLAEMKRAADRVYAANMTFHVAHANLALSLHDQLQQERAAQAEVWMNPNGYVELMAVRGRLTLQDIKELEADLNEESPGAGVLDEGLHLVPVERNRYMDEDYTVACLNWDRAVFQPHDPQQAQAGEAL